MIVGCTVCGKITDKLTGFIKHPICHGCYKDEFLKGQWAKALRQDYPSFMEAL